MTFCSLRVKDSTETRLSRNSSVTPDTRQEGQVRLLFSAAGEIHRYWTTVHLSSKTSTGAQPVPGQLLLPFSRAGISNILCSPSTSPHLFSPVSANDNVVYIPVKIKKPFQRPTSSFSIIHTNLPGSRLLLPFLHNPKPNLTLNFGLHSVHLPRDSDASSPSLHLLLLPLYCSFLSSFTQTQASFIFKCNTPPPYHPSG